MFRLLARTISETTIAIIGSLGSDWRVISCKLGHNVGKVVIIEVTIALGKLDLLNEMLMTVVHGERNRGMEGMSFLPAYRNRKFPRFRKRGSLMA